MKYFPPSTDPIGSAIAMAGITGITAKQLCKVTRLPLGEVNDRVGVLASANDITRIGRGLWVLHKYAILESGEETFHGPVWYLSRFETAFGLKVGAQEGEIQFNPNERRPVHRWWPYVQGFSAGFVESVIRKFGLGPRAVVLDPFCGCGTVPVTARLLGIQGIGIDMMPIASFAAAAKCKWEADPAQLLMEAQKVVRGKAEPEPWRPFLMETERQFKPEVLQTLLRLRTALWGLEEGSVKTLLKVAFAKLLIDSSNLKRAPCLGYTKKVGLTGETPNELFLASVRRISEDLQKLQAQRGTWGPPPSIHTGSSAKIELPEASVDLAITSPPYVNGLDYAMNYKIELAWMGFINSYKELSALRASMVSCDNIPRGTVASYSSSGIVQRDDWLDGVAKSIDQNICTKGSYRRDDMGSVVRKYFDDLVPVIRKVFFSLKTGKRFVVVNGDSLIAGTYVPGDLIFARLAIREGFRVEGFDIARIRRSGQRRSFLLRESVLTLQKP